MGKGTHDLSDMWIVRHAYADKADKYVRMHGHLNFAAGGAFHDVFNMIGKYGIVPESAYDGMVINQDNHVHGEMDHVFSQYMEGVIANKNRKLTNVWKKGFEGLLDAYLGEAPGEFTYEGKTYTPQSFTESLGLNMDDYVALSSFTHHPFYEQFILEVPDNWAWGEMYNLPLNEMMQTMDYAIEKGYTIAWASDVSEKGFSHKNGVAIIPDADKQERAGSEMDKWESLTKKEKDKLLYSFEEIVAEKEIDQAIRQEAFDNYETTDDHGMHIVGTAVDQKGNKYYRVKNSWADNSNDLGGYFYASVPFVQYKTLNIVVHKDAVPPAILKKLKR
jgi:bleomycin hydrolase